MRWLKINFNGSLTEVDYTNKLTRDELYYLISFLRAHEFGQVDKTKFEDKDGSMQRQGALANAHIKSDAYYRSSCTFEEELHDSPTFETPDKVYLRHEWTKLLNMVRAKINSIPTQTLVNNRHYYYNKIIKEMRKELKL